MNNNSRKSKAKILVIKHPLIDVEDEDNDEIYSEQTLEDYHDLKEKCEKVILKIKKRKQQKQVSAT